MGLGEICLWRCAMIWGLTDGLKLTISPMLACDFYYVLLFCSQIRLIINLRMIRQNNNNNNGICWDFGPPLCFLMKNISIYK